MKNHTFTNGLTFDEARMGEAALINSARRGDLAAFNELILSYQNSLFGVAMRMLGDEDLAADVLQETLISAFRNLNTFRGEAIKYWLTRIVVNACYDALRRKLRQRTVPLERVDANDEEMEPERWMADPTAGPEEHSETHELERAIAACLQSLTPDFRTILVLVDIEDHSYEETAYILRIPINTVKSRLARARMKMRQELQRFEDQLPARYQIGYSPQG